MVYSTLEQSPPLDLSHHFSAVTKRRENSLVKSLYKYMIRPNVDNMAGGLPNASYFPYETLEATVAHPQRFAVSPTTGGEDARATDRMVVPKETPRASAVRKIDVATALQYGTSEGLPALATFVRQFTREHLHPNIPYAGGPATLLTTGATDGLAKAVETFTTAWDPRRDWINQREGVLCEEFVFMNAIQTFQPRGVNVATVAIDAQGMLAHGKGGLADVLENWDFKKGRRPHLMYTITIGQNPTGGNLSVERRREIYALCQQYDILIIEDDPYWNLQYPSAAATEAQYRGSPLAVHPTPRNYNAHGRSSGYAFLDSLVPSYLSIDTDGRVVRLDTFSKTIAPGCRLGWITAQPAFIERMTRITETSTQQPSGFVQAMVAELILGQQVESDGGAAAAGRNHGSGSGSKPRKGEKQRAWQMDGWVRWLEGLRASYEQRMRDMCTVLEEGKYLVDADFNRGPSPHEVFGAADADADADAGTWEVLDKVQMYDFTWPMGGMFVWLKISIETHPLLQTYGAERLSKALWLQLMEEPYLCLVSPGSLFAPTSATKIRSQQYFRLCFAAMPAEEVAGITRRLVDGFRAFWKRKNLDGLEDEEAMMQRLQRISFPSPPPPTGIKFAVAKTDHDIQQQHLRHFPSPTPPLSNMSPLNPDLAEEIEAITAIYDPETITISSNSDTPTTKAPGPSTLTLGGSATPPTDTAQNRTATATPTTTLRLQIPNHPHLSFLLGFSPSYPDAPPLILGTASTAARGEGKLAVDILSDILGRVYTAGSVCLFDLISEAEAVFTELGVGGGGASVDSNSGDGGNGTRSDSQHEEVDDTKLNSATGFASSSVQLHETFGLEAPPEWVLSDVITEKKSVFVGRAAQVSSLDQAKGFLDYLLATDKKVAGATHNISAWRIRERKVGGGNGKSGSSHAAVTTGDDAAAGGDVSIVQDCDDDGETAAGGRLLHLMQLMDVWDVVVVVTRWYGGVLLGPDRFRIINAAGRDALVKGGFVKESGGGNGEGAKKKKGRK
ncbi:PLP-dependent transferase [Aspergillus saccharolyticus JOP 1030-1]|uniref:PLP-dependent transferase n=1 Tax=Aspergillus saccharolyticus JOP 1030-1 TaxID=1450539 RepID=A0A318ZFA3_9EURO|nr:PLP-dependent transferase [Aspergillus saccharolyticus JOP 1030-1]PYH45765.1 PLP-dependent transferase [Aspergillus saccharolyticus JOP 1030-1]